MKKIIASAALTLSLALAACGDSSDADDEFAGENVEDIADDALADVPEDAEPVAVETAEPEATTAAPDRRKTLEESGNDAEAAANEIEAAIAAEFEQAEEARDAEVD